MKKMTQQLIVLFLLLVSSIGYSQKVAIIGMNHVSTAPATDGFSFLVTQDLAAGEVIYFTENEYNDATNTFVDTTAEAIIAFTAGSIIPKGNVIFVNESVVTANSFSVTCTSGGSCGTASLVGVGPFALATGGESFYAYSDSDSNILNGISTIHSVLYTGFFEGANAITGGDIPASQNPIFDYPNAIVIDGFPSAPTPDRVEFKPTTLDRTNVTKIGLENPTNYVHGVTNSALSTIFFTNFNLTGTNPTLTLTASPSSVNENSGTGMVYTFTLSATATSNISVNFSVGGSATFGTDYLQSGASSFNTTTGSVTIINGSNTASITLTSVADSVLEPNELISLTLNSGSGYITGSPSLASTTINNDDTLNITPIVAITGINHSTTNDGFSFVALQDIAAGTTIYFTENPFVNSSLSFSGSEAVMQWTAPTGGLQRGQVVVVTETTPNIFATSCSSGNCGAITLVSGSFTLATTGEELYAYLDSDNNPSNGVSSVQAVLYTGTSIVSGGDIQSAQNPSLVYVGAVIVDGFPAVPPLRTEYNPTLRNVTVNRANFQNPANWIHAQSNITLSTVPFANIIISTGVANPFASVTVSPSNVIENSATTMVYTFSLTSVASSNVTINFSVGGNAVFSTDYNVGGASFFNGSSGSVVIPTGASSASVSITPIGDALLEIQESVVLTITSGSGYDGGSPNSATGFINNDDTSDSDPLVAIVGMSHLDPDGFSFVAAQDIPANTIVYFTDNSFNNATLLFGSGEGVIRWTSPNTTISKGNVVVITETAPDTFAVSCSNGTCGNVTLISGNLAIATTGETLYAYEDNDTNPSNGVTDIYAVLFTGTSSVSGGNLPAIEDPSNIFLKALVVDGFPAIAPARTEYDATKRGVAVSSANFEDLSNWVHAQTPPTLSTVPFANLNIVDNIPPTAICQNISVTPNVGSGSVTIAATDINNGSTDNAGILSYAIDIDTFTCANVGNPVAVTLTVTDTSGNSATCTATVTVLPNVTSTFTQINPICIGGSFSLPTISNNGFTGTWSPAINNTVTTTYTFTPNVGQCGGPTTMTVVVNPSVTPTFDPVAPICEGATLSALPTTSLNGITGSWSPTLNNTATTTYIFTPDAGQCANTTTLTITVNVTPPPISADINVTFTGQCGFLSGTYVYEGLLNGKASFYGIPSPNVKISYDGVKWVLWDSNVNIGNTGFQNTNVPAGLYPPLTGWTPTLCSSGTMDITNTSSFELCDGATIASLPVTGSNIQWYDAATNGTILSPSTILVSGSYYVTQTINGCESSRGEVIVLINPNIVPTFNSVASVCSGGSIDALPTTSLNGINGSWSPVLNNTETTTYTFTPNIGQCATTASLTIVVNPVTTTSQTITACDSYTWSDNGMTYTTSGVYTNSTTVSGCTSVATLNLTIQNSTTYYADSDADGFGNPNNSILSCSQPVGFVVNNDDCNDANATVYPGAVDICGDGIDNDCNGVIDNVGLLGGCIPVLTSVQNSQCGATLATIDQYVYANAVQGGAQGYRFRVTKMVGGVPSTNPADVQTIDTFLRLFRITQLASYAFNTTYQVEVSIRRNNVWQPFYGTPCTVTTPATTTSIQSSQCGSTLTLMTDVIYANGVQFGSGYRFKITNTLTSQVQIVDRNIRDIRMSLLTNPIASYNTTYTIEVAVRNTDGTYLPYGSACNVTTPSFPTTQIQAAQCNYNVLSNSEIISADSFNGISGYRFKFVNGSFNYVLERLTRTFTLKMVPGIVSGESYNVQVSILINGVWGPYGNTCSLTAPSSANSKHNQDLLPSSTSEVAYEFKAIAYPNPFEENLKLKVTTDSQEAMQVRVYDMIGKLVEDRKVEVAAMETFEVGSNYPSGVYNVIVSQGANTQTVRVVKR